MQLFRGLLSEKMFSSVTKLFTANVVLCWYMATDSDYGRAPGVPISNPSKGPLASNTGHDLVMVCCSTRCHL